MAKQAEQILEEQLVSPLQKLGYSFIIQFVDTFINGMNSK